MSCFDCVHIKFDFDSNGYCGCESCVHYRAIVSEDKDSRANKCINYTKREEEHIDND